MATKTLYRDKLVEIDGDSILVRGYYFPFGDRRIDFAAIERILVLNPTLLSGKYRYYGTGDFRTWFPPDNRVSRDKIFIIKLNWKWWRIGVTVEDSRQVLALLKEKCVVIDKSADS